MTRPRLRHAFLPTLLPTVLFAALLGLAWPGKAGAAVPDLTDNPPVHFRVGASVLDDRLGPLELQREFRDTLGNPGPHPTATTFKTWDEPAIRAWIAAAPTGSALDFWHEPENDPAQMPAELWAQRTRRLADLVQQEHRVGQVTPAATLMDWTLDPRSHRQALLARLLPPQTLRALRDADGLLGWDSYAGPESGRTPQQMYGSAAQFSTDQQLPWAVMETGARHTDHSDTDADLDAQAWQERFRHLASDQIAAPPRWVLAWNPRHTDHGAFAIQNDPATAAVWRWASQRYGSSVAGGATPAAVIN